MAEPKRLTDEELLAIGERHRESTLGPYRWDVATKHRSVRLESIRSPGNIIMDFVRWGMRDAAPRFRDFFLMERVEHFARERKSHHVGWDQDIDHPDAVALAHSWSDREALLTHIAALEAENAELRRLLAGRVGAHRTQEV